MSKEYRFFPKIVAGLLAVGGIAALAEREAPPVKQESPVKEVETPVQKKEEISEEEKQFRAEHPIEAELRAAHVSEADAHAALQDAAELIRSHRYEGVAQEETYFAACKDAETWKQVKQHIHEASEKTGVPERVLIAMGFIESQFKEQAERKDTQVYGPYQMTLETARESAKEAEACFGTKMEVQGVKDLKDTKTAVRLAALRLRTLKKRYGQLGLAIVGYAGGHVGLEKKIKEAFPDVDLGGKDWSDMERHHKAEGEAQKLRDRILARMKRGRGTDADRAALRAAVRTFEAAGQAYTKAKASWKQKRAALPIALSEAGVNLHALYAFEKKRGGDVPHSLTYPLALDDIAERARKQEQTHVVEAGEAK